MDLLNTHLMNQTIVSRELWFYFYIILFAFAGIPKGDLATLQGLPFTSGQKAIILQFQ